MEEGVGGRQLDVRHAVEGHVGQDGLQSWKRDYVGLEQEVPPARLSTRYRLLKS